VFLVNWLWWNLAVIARGTVIADILIAALDAEATEEM
jgi:hypothetical protein